jgi:hypothetical protein
MHKIGNPDQFVSVPKSKSTQIIGYTQKARKYLQSLEQQKKRKIKPEAPKPGRLPKIENTINLPKPKPSPVPQQQFYYQQTNPLKIGFEFTPKAPRTIKQYTKPQPKFDQTRIFKQMPSFEIVNPLNQMNIKKLRYALNKKISQNRKKAPEYLTKQQLEPALKLMQELKFKYNYPFTQTGEKIYQDYKKLLVQASKKQPSKTIDDSFSGWNKPAPGTFPLSDTQMRKLYGTMHLGRRY